MRWFLAYLVMFACLLIACALFKLWLDEVLRPLPPSCQSWVDRLLTFHNNF